MDGWVYGRMSAQMDNDGLMSMCLDEWVGRWVVEQWNGWIGRWLDG